MLSVVCIGRGPVQRWGPEGAAPGASLLSQQHPLQAVRGHADLVLGLGVALRVGAAGRRALRGAQVVHQGQAVLPAEVHELDVAHARVKVHACNRRRAGGGL